MVFHIVQFMQKVRPLAPSTRGNQRSFQVATEFLSTSFRCCQMEVAVSSALSIS